MGTAFLGLRDYGDLPVVLQDRKPDLFRPGATTGTQRRIQLVDRHLHAPQGPVVNRAIVDQQHGPAFHQGIDSIAVKGQPADAPVEARQRGGQYDAPR
jgi:hypothetical protein